MPTMQADHVDATDAAKQLGIHQNTVTKLLANGEFSNAFRLGRYWRIPISDIEAFIERRRQAARDERASRSAGKKPPAVT